MQADISRGLVDIKQKLQELLKLNLTREDLAKLKEHEFYLDLEELDRLQKESDTEMLKVRICFWFALVAGKIKYLRIKLSICIDLVF